jgi:Flp pilus assembly protein TadD
MSGIRTIFTVLAAVSVAGAAFGQTDPYKLQIDHAKQLRLAGNPDGASLIVRDVLTKSPTNFRALYTKGLIELDQRKPSSAVATLNSAVTSLNGQPAPDPSIFNTLGYALMNEGRLDEAGNAFQKGYVVRSSLSSASQQKLLNNMSLLYRLKGDQASASRYLAQAAAAGSPLAKTNIVRAGSK